MTYFKRFVIDLLTYINTTAKKATSIRGMLYAILNRSNPKPI